MIPPAQFLDDALRAIPDPWTTPPQRVEPFPSNKRINRSAYTHLMGDGSGLDPKIAYGVADARGMPPTPPPFEQLELNLNLPAPAVDVPIDWDALKNYPTDSAWHANQGWKRGFEYGTNDGKGWSKSVILDRAPNNEYSDLNPIGQAAYLGGRVAGDIVGHGTRHYYWRIQPGDVANTLGNKLLGSTGISPGAVMAGGFGTALALDIGSGNFNPLNLAQGGRPLGYSAISASEEDPRESTNPVMDMVVDRGIMGRRGRVLPWEQFHAERPDVDYQTYADYKDYQFNKDPGLLNKLTLGIVKGTPDGINGPELSIAGYGVTPLGAAAALGTLGAAVYGAKRVARLR